jgi:hypothetical protein
MHDGLARQMRWQRPPDRLTALAPRCGIGGIVARRIGRDPGVVLGSIFLELADQQLELLDVAIELFRRPAEAGAAQHRQLHLQLLDVQRLGVDLGVARGDLDILARQLRLQACRQRAQRLRIIGQRSARQ